MHSTGRVSPVTGFVENINICMRLLPKIFNLFTLMLDTGLEVTESRLEQLGHVQNMIMNMITPVTNSQLNSYRTLFIRSFK